MGTRSGIALTAVLALGSLAGLTGCGSTEDKKSDLEMETAPVEVTLFSAPSARVTVDGAPVGTTPGFVCLTPGTHELTFSREGFRTESRRVVIQANATVKVEVDLVASSPHAESAIAELARVMELEREPLDQAPLAKRGATEAGVTLVWPLGKIRVAALTTYRIDAGPRYKGDGFLVFRQGAATLHRSAFKPKGLVTIGEIPRAVLARAGVGGTIEWGVTFDRGGSDVLATVEPVRIPAVAREMGRLAARGPFRAQAPLLQHVLLTDVLRTHGLFCEALQRYLAIAQSWPESGLPMKGLMTSARKLGLTRSPLYGAAAHRVSGSPGAGLPAPLTGGPDLAALLGEAATVPAPGDAEPPEDTAEPEEVTDRAALEADLRRTASGIERLSRESRELAEKTAATAEKAKRAEAEYVAARQALARATGEVKKAEGAGDAAALDAARKGLTEAEKAMKEARAALAEVQKDTRGLTSEAVEAAAAAEQRRAAELSRTAAQINRAADSVGAAASIPAPMTEAADALLGLADWLDAEARSMEDGAARAEAAKAEREKAKKAVKAAQDAFAKAEAALREAEDAVLAAEESEEKKAARVSMEKAHGRLEEARKELRRSGEQASGSRRDFYEALKASGGLPPGDAREAAAAARRRAKELRQKADQLWTEAEASERSPELKEK
ncbi:MAG: PEGA domain-containing protein [Planctomycetota bacterium]|jgi:hypothetical protein